jgi:hypothetical protein
MIVPFKSSKPAAIGFIPLTVWPFFLKKLINAIVINVLPISVSVPVTKNIFFFIAFI